jgi:hypothetical protein
MVGPNMLIKDENNVMLANYAMKGIRVSIFEK